MWPRSRSHWRCSSPRVATTTTQAARRPPPPVGRRRRPPAASDTATTEGSSTESTEGETGTTDRRGRLDALPAAPQDFDGAEVTITGSERDDPSVIAINDGLAGVRRGQQHRHHLHRRRRLGSEHQHPGRRAATRRTSASSRSPASSPTSPGPASIKPLADRGRTPPSSEYWAEDYSDYADVDGDAVRRPGEDRPQVARLVQAGRRSRRPATRCPRRSTSSPRSSRR